VERASPSATTSRISAFMVSTTSLCPSRSLRDVAGQSSASLTSRGTASCSGRVSTRASPVWGSSSARLPRSRRLPVTSKMSSLNYILDFTRFSSSKGSLRPGLHRIEEGYLLSTSLPNSVNMSRWRRCPYLSKLSLCNSVKEMSSLPEPLCHCFLSLVNM